MVQYFITSDIAQLGLLPNMRYNAVYWDKAQLGVVERNMVWSDKVRSGTFIAQLGLLPMMQWSKFE